MTVLTYGTYDLLHYGHVNFLRRAKALAGEDGKLIVGLSTDDFHENLKHKPPCTFNYKQRKCMLESLKYIDQIIPEENWEQKADDIQKYKAEILVMGDDWDGQFDQFSRFGCKVMTLPRTEDGWKPVSDTELKIKIGRQWMEDQNKVDIVVTYVKEDAPGFIQERNGWMPKSEACSIEGGQSGSCRWRDWGFLNYWFRGVEKNATWVNKVFLIVKDETHLPKWLNLDHPKLRVVFHDEYIPKRFLPTFNTHTIEMFYAKIRGLSEHFITCNDDFFFFQPVPKDYFVKDGFPVRDYQTCETGQMYKKILESNNDWDMMLKNGYRLLSKIYFGGTSEFPPYGFRYTHLPELRCKSLEADLLKRYEMDLYDMLGDGKFRTRKNCCSSWMFIDALKYDDRYKKIQRSDVYSKSSFINIKLDKTLKKIWKNAVDEKAEMMCINDTELLVDDFFPIARCFITENLMPTVLPEKCSFEK